MNNNLSNENDASIMDGSLKVTQQQTTHSHSKRGGVGWVSTELHLHAAQNWMDFTVLKIMSVGAGTLFDFDRNDNCHVSIEDDLRHCCIDIDMCTTSLFWLGLIKENSSTNNHSILSRKFNTFSQGEQKLLLIASCIAQRPSIIILDEPCQGLDIWNRARVLGLMNVICESTDMALVYITHHEEELMDGIDRVLRLEDGKIVYCGERLS